MGNPGSPVVLLIAPFAGPGHSPLLAAALQIAALAVVVGAVLAVTVSIVAGHADVTAVV